MHEERHRVGYEDSLPGEADLKTTATTSLSHTLFLHKPFSSSL